MDREEGYPNSPVSCRCLVGDIDPADRSRNFRGLQSVLGTVALITFTASRVTKRNRGFLCTGAGGEQQRGAQHDVDVHSR